MTVHDGASLKVVQEINLPDGVTAVNVYYFECDFAVDQDEADVVTGAEEWIEVLYATMVAYVKSTVSLGTMTAYVWNAVTSLWDSIGDATPAYTPTDVNDMLPHGVSGLVRAYTANPRTIGRKYLPGMCEDAHEDGGWVAGAIGDLTDFAAKWDDPKEISPTNDLIPSVVQQSSMIPYNLSGTTVVLADPAYQRRRRPGTGT